MLPLIAAGLIIWALESRNRSTDDDDTESYSEPIGSRHTQASPSVIRYRGIELRNIDGKGDTQRVTRNIDRILDSSAGHELKGLKRINYTDTPYHEDLKKHVRGWCDGRNEITLGTNNTDRCFVRDLGHEFIGHGKNGHTGYKQWQEDEADAAGEELERKVFDE